jgi:hypothetical protein
LLSLATLDTQPPVALAALAALAIVAIAVIASTVDIFAAFVALNILAAAPKDLGCVL